MPPDAGSLPAPARRVNAKSRGQEWDAPSTPSFQAQDNQETRPPSRRPGIGRSDARRRSCGLRVPVGWILGSRRCAPFSRHDLGDERRVEPHQRRHDDRLAPRSRRPDRPRQRPDHPAQVPRPPRRGPAGQEASRREGRPGGPGGPAGCRPADHEPQPSSQLPAAAGQIRPTPRSGSASATPKKAAATPGARVTAAGPTSSRSAPGKSTAVPPVSSVWPGRPTRTRSSTTPSMPGAPRTGPPTTAADVRPAPGVSCSARGLAGVHGRAEEPSTRLGRPRPGCVMLAGPPDRRSCRRAP